MKKKLSPYLLALAICIGVVCYIATRSTVEITPQDDSAESVVTEVSSSSEIAEIETKEEQSNNLVVTAPAADKAENVPTELLLSQREKLNFYESGQLVEQRDSKPDKNGVFQRIKVFKTDFKHPYIRVEEKISRDPHDQSETVIDHVAMVADHFIVRLPEAADEAELESFLQSMGGKLERAIPNQPIYKVQLPKPQIAIYDDAKIRLDAMNESVAYVDPDFIVHTLDIPNDPSFSQLWGLNNTGQSSGTSDADIDAPEAWDVAKGSLDILVGVIDTGVDHTHPDLSANMWTNPNEIPDNNIDDDGNGYIDDVRGWDFVNNDNDPMDDHYHGTHCAGTIGAVGDNGIGVVGVAQKVSMVGLKFLSSGGSGTTLDAVAAVYYGTSIGVDLTSNSWGGGGFSNSLKDAIDDALSNDILFVAAAGNDGRNTDFSATYPAGYDSANIISVAALDHNDQMAYFTNYGAVTVDLGAPGVNIYSTVPGSSYRSLNGTSMACPHVAGACALIKSINPSASWTFIKDAIMNNTDPVTALTGKAHTGGRLNMANAIISVSGPHINLNGFTFDDSSGNGDSIINPGEAIALTSTLHNIGSETAKIVDATLTLISPDPEVTLTDASSSYGDIASGTTSSNQTDPFLLQFAPTITTPHTVNLRLDLTDSDSNTWSAELQLTVYSSSVISGRVTDLVDNNPVAQAVVHYSGSSAGSTSVNSDGSYSISVIDGTYSVHATASNFLASDPVLVTTPPSQTNVDFALGFSKVQVNPLSVTSTQVKDSSTTQQFTVSNLGSATLEYSINAQSTSTQALITEKSESLVAQDGPGIRNVAIPYEDSFEDGDFSGWSVDGSSGTREIVSDVAAHGSYSFHYQSSLSNAHQQGIHRDFISNSKPRYISFFVRSGSTLTSDGYFSVGDTSSYFREAILFYAADDGTFKVNSSEGGDQSFNYIAQRWYRIEFRNIDWVAKTFDYYVDGVEIKSDIGFRNSADVDEFSRVYLYNFSESSEAWWDRISFYDTSSFWLKTSPTVGSIPPGGSQVIDVTLNASDLIEGTYLADIDILSNDLESPRVSVPVTMNVTETPNTIPVADPQTVSNSEDTWHTITLTGSDSDGDSLSAFILKVPDNGKLYQTTNGIDLGSPIDGPTLVSNSQRKVIFVPNVNAFASPYTSFDFAVYDGRASSASQTVTVNVTPVNDAPVARNDYASGLPGQTIASIPVLLNDTDIEGDTLSITSFTQGSQGTVTNNGDNTLSYVPNADFTEGSDLFTYTISDGAGESATANVTIRLGSLAGGNWNMYRNDAAHSGYYPGVLGGKNFSLSWSFGGLTDRAHYPVVRDNTVYFTLIDYNSEMPVYALDVSTGTKKWEYNLGQVYRTTPVSLGDGKLYCTSAKSGGNQLYAIDSQTGLLDWQEGYAYGNDYIGYGPTLSDDTVYFNDHYQLRAHNSDTGSEVFTSTVTGNDYGWTPTIGNDQVFTFIDGTLRSFDPDTGVENWSLAVNTSIYGDLVVSYAENRIFIASSYGLYAVNTITQKVEWSVTGTSFKSTPAVANGRVYAVGSSGNFVKSYDINDGTELFNYATGFYGVNDIVVTDDTLFAASNYNTYIIDLLSGTQLQRLNDGGTIALYEGVLLISDYSYYGIRCYVPASDTNTAPTATDVSASITEDTIGVTQLAGTDAERDGLVAIVTSLPSQGQLYQTSDGTTQGALITEVPAIVENSGFKLLYQPPLNGFGDNYDSFSFKVNDGVYFSSEAAVTVDVTGVNDVPTAVDDNYFTRSGEILEGLQPQSNDIDPDLEILTISSFTQPSQGNVVQEVDGTLTYTPNDSFSSGSDSFTYIVSDAALQTSTATITITIDNLIGTSWPTFGNGPDHTGNAQIRFASGDLSLKWEIDLDVSLHQAAIAEGRVYVTPASSRFANNWIVALDERTGSRVWFNDLTFGSPGNYVNPPTYFEGRVLMQRGKGVSYGAGTPAESRLWCFDSTSGEEIWSSPLAVQWEQYLAPCAADDSVWVYGGSYGGLDGFDLKTGTQDFSQDVEQYDKWTPAYYKGKLYSFVSGNFRNHDPLTGVEIWSISFPWNWGGYDMRRTVTFGDNRAFFINNGDNYSLGDLIAVDLDQQSVVWQLPEAALKYSTPAVSNGVIYALTNNGINAYSSGTGQLLGSYVANDAALTYQPIVTSNRLFASSNSATYIFDLNTRNLLQTIPHGGKISVANDSLYLAGYDGIMRSYIVVDDSNDAPAAEDITVTMLEEAQVVLPLQATDTEGDALQYVIKQLPASGTLYQTEDGITPTTEITLVPAAISNSLNQVIYQAPLDGFGDGLGNFTYAAIDHQSFSNTATVTVNVTNTNDPPVAVDDVVSGTANKRIANFNPLNNDRDVDNDSLSVISFSQGTYGSVTQNPDGSLNYQPGLDLDEITDTFTYTVADPTGESDRGSVTVHISSTLGSEWTTFGNGPSHSGYYPRTMGVSPLKMLWEFDAIARPAPVVVAEGRVYTTNVIDGLPGLSALEQSTGAELWRVDLEPGSINPPTYADNSVYVQRGNHSSDTQLWCFNASDGSTNWSAPHGAQWQRYYAPCVFGDGVWVNGGSYGGMYGFDTADGNQRFFHNLPQEDEWTPSFHQGKLYSFVEGVFANHDPDDGTVIWSIDLSWDYGGMYRTVAFEGEFAYLINNSDDYGVAQELVCIDLVAQSVLWEIAGAFKGTPAVSQGVVFAIEGSKVKAYAGNGTLLRSYETGDTGISHQPIIANDLVFISSNNQTFIFDRFSTSLLQTLSQGGPLSLAGNVLYIAGYDGRIQAWAADNPDNSLPVPDSQALTVYEDTALTVTLSGSDNDGDTMHFAIQTLPVNGKLYQTSDGTTAGEEITRTPAYVSDSLQRVIYVPRLDSNGDGIGNFSFAIGDGKGISSVETVSIDVTPINDAPIAVADTRITKPGQIISPLRLALNDIDVDGDNLIIIEMTTPTSGEVVINEDGTLRFESDSAMVSSTVTFDYTVQDPSGATSTSTVTIRISEESGASWTTFGNGPDHTGYSPLDFEAGSWTLDWSKNLESTRGLNQIAVSGGLAFVTPFVYRDPTFIVALDIETGDEVWRYDFAEAYSINPPTYFDGNVYAQRNNSGNDSQLWSFNGKSGDVNWQAPFSAQSGRYMAPAVDTSGVYVNGGYYGGMYGFDVADGSQKFFQNLAQVSGWTPSLHQEKLYTMVNGVFTQHGKTSGAMIWSIDLGNSATRVPAFDSDYAYVNLYGELVCIDLVSREVAWRVSGNFNGSPAVSKGTVYAIRDRNIVALSSTTGFELGIFDTAQTFSSILNQPIVTNRLVFASTGSRVYIFDLNTYELIQTLPHGGDISIAGEQLFIAGDDGYVYAYSAPESIQFTPNDGTEQTDKFDVTVTANNPAATIYFTLDGSPPSIDSLSMASGGNITIFSDTTVRAIAVEGSYFSPIYEASFYVTDIDNDQIPDSWELLYFSDLSVSNGLVDSDGDGMTDLEEFISGTSPIDHSDRFAMEISKSKIRKDSVELSSKSIQGRIYCIEASADLENWTRVSEWLMGDGSTMQFSEDALQQVPAKRFYRIIVK